MNLKRDDKLVQNDVSTAFEELYIRLRGKEDRIYTDEEVMWLPDISEDHIHKREWEIRKASCKRLIRYLRHKNKKLRILEVGCGNGWLSYQLSQLPHSRVIGLDINLPELQQAERVFGTVANLSFVYGAFGTNMEPGGFDIIVFAASLQYFHSFSDVVITAMQNLGESGEVHILDSHFYLETEMEEASQRSRSYFQERGFDGMHRFYFHHSVKDLEEFNCTILYNPRSVVNKILNRKNPFYWVRITR
jgi:SAM-dependent methyltransferase